MGLRPNIVVETNSALSLTAQGGTGTIAMIGSAQWGPIGEAQTLNSFNQALSVFKDDLSGDSLSLIKGLDLAYRNGASTILAVRVDDGAATESTLELLSGVTTGITVSGKYKGTYGDNILVTVTENANTAANRDVEITDGQVVETYNNAGEGYTTNLSMSEAITAGSTLVTATTNNNTYLIDAVTQTNLSGGDNGEDELIAADYTAIIDDELYLEDYNILVIPSETDDSFHSTIVGKLNTRASNEKKFAVYFSGISKDETISTAAARTASGRRLSLVAPNITYVNRVDGTTLYLDGSYLACAYAGKTAQGWPELSGTHKTLSIGGLSINETAKTKYYNNGEQEQLLTKGIVPVTKIGNVIQPARAVTRNASTTEVWFEQNIVDIVDYVKEQVIDVLNPFIGQPNLASRRTAMAKNVDGILEQNILDEVIVGYENTIVNEGTSPDTVLVQLTIKPTFLVNFINVTLTLDNTSS